MQINVGEKNKSQKLCDCFSMETGYQELRKGEFLPLTSEADLALSLFSSDTVIVKNSAAEYPPKMLVLSTDNQRILL